jgi:hypothetical protein
MVNDRAAIALLALRAHNIMTARVNEQETCGLTTRHCEPTRRANARPMTSSAKQSRAAHKELDCFVAALLAVTIAGYHSVIAGLDPAIHPSSQIFLIDGYAGQARV